MRRGKGLGLIFSPKVGLQLLLGSLEQDSSGQAVLELEQCGHIARVWPGAASRLQQSHWDKPAQLLLVTVVSMMPMIFTSCVLQIHLKQLKLTRLTLSCGKQCCCQPWYMLVLEQRLWHLSQVLNSHQKYTENSKVRRRERTRYQHI